MEVSNERPNPYIGPRPFSLKEKDLFFGRDRELNDVVNLIFAYSVVLLNAQSGAGKTSLVNAGVIPKLTQEGHAILRTRVRDPLPDSVKPDPQSNFFVFKALVAWNENNPNPTQYAQTSFASYLENCDRPVDEDGEPLLRVLIFDQFEEIFTSYLNHWQDRREFFSQLGDALRKDRQLRVLIVMREEYVSRLGVYAELLPEKLRIRYYLEHLRHDAAVNAIIKPLVGTGRTFADDAAHELALNLSNIYVEIQPGKRGMVQGEFVEPVQLQIVCQNLWGHLPDDVTLITSTHIAKFGDVTQALSGFYEGSIKTAAEKTKINERVLREWIEHNLITREGTPAIVHRGNKDTADLPNPVIDVLEDQRLIRSEPRAGIPWYELSHDRFVAAVQGSNRKWQEKYAQERRSQFLVSGVAFLILFALIVAVLGSIFARNAQAQVAAAEYNVAQAVWASTRVVGLGGYPPTAVTEIPAEQFLATATAQAMPITKIAEQKDGVDMVFVPAGCFWMGYLTGDENERPAFDTCIETPFWIDQYEVTNEQFDTVMNNGQTQTSENDRPIPKTAVTWREALDYCQARNPNASLPSEIEWEYAARGPNSLLYPWGNIFDGNPSYVIYGGNSDGPRIGTSPETSRRDGESWVGAYDMSGNVREWTTTIYDETKFGYPLTPEGESDSTTDETVERVVRGGSFSSQDSSDLTTTQRGHKLPKRPLGDVGFRCVLHIAAEPHP